MHDVKYCRTVVLPYFKYAGKTGQPRHTFIFVDKAGFNLQKHTTDGKQRPEIIMCTALPNDGLLLQNQITGSHTGIAHHYFESLHLSHIYILSNLSWGQ